MPRAALPLAGAAAPDDTARNRALATEAGIEPAAGSTDCTTGDGSAGFASQPGSKSVAKSTAAVTYLAGR